MSALKILPRVAPRDAADAAISLGIGLLQTAVLFGLPALGVYYFTHSIDTAFAVSCGLYLIFMARCVTNVVVSAEGLRLSRMFGMSSLIPWAAISSIEEVSREELIRQGWLWPIVFPREMTPTITSLGHYRIRFGQRWIYFPPSNAAAFQAAVQVHLHK